MERYYNYKLEDFLQDDDFRRWVKSGAERSGTVWERLLLAYPDKTETFELAVRFVLQWKKTPSALSDEQMFRDIRVILSDITKKEEKRPVFGGFLRYAAAFLLASGIVLFFWSRKADSTAVPIATTEDLVRIANTGTTDRVLVLPDNSKVTLSPGGRVSYPRTWAEKATRNVSLSGEAFFEVRKDSLKPFLVTSGGVVTRVMGTSFTVRSGPADVSVTVRTGKVSVYRIANTRETVVLTPNQKAIYTASEKTITRALAEIPVLINRNELKGKPGFDEEPATAILEALERAYGIPIRFDSNMLRNCFLTLPFQEEPFYHKLDILCKTLNASYRIENNEVVIDSNGCE